MTIPGNIKGITFVLCFILLGTGFTGLWGQDTLASGEVTVKGASLQLEPAQQAVPVNTGTAVNTVFDADNPGLLQGMLVKGTLRGPGINGEIKLTTLPNHPFSIPGFAVKGTYTLEDIHLERNGEYLLAAEPPQAVIEAMDIIVTRVETRPLTLDEIREKGIVISQDNFSVYNFSVGFVVNSEVVTYDFPVVYQGNGEVYIPGGGGGGGAPLGGFREPIAVDFELPELETPDSGGGGTPPPAPKVSGIVVFNNDIAFLNQFFSVMFIVSNNAPEGSTLALENMTAKITYPGGLRAAETNPPTISGTPIPVHCPGPDGRIGTADDVDIIFATFSGMAEFLAEGLKEGTHVVTIDFDGTLSGLPSGDTPVIGSAAGAVIVRNPSFSITFSHPSVIRKGEEYDIYVNMTNTSPVDANLVSLTLPQTRLVGTELLSGETVSFETIGSGESGTATYHLRAKRTGRIRASAFEADGNVAGKFVLTAGVGEEGIPLSPDTLVLPDWAYLLPDELVNSGLMLLGEAYSIATTPAGGLPEHLPYMEKGIVKERAVEFAEAGQRYDFGEPLAASVQQLTLGWLGNGTADIGFDRLRRLTSKGVSLARVQAGIFDEELKNQTPAEFQAAFGETCFYMSPYFSAGLSFDGAPRTAYINITDEYGNRLSNVYDELARDIPYGELYPCKDGGGGPVDLALVGRMDAGGYTVEVVGAGTGSFDFSMVVPDNGGGFRLVSFNGVECRNGSVSTVAVNTAENTFTLFTDLDGDGTADEEAAGTVTAIGEPALQLLSATQDCSLDALGHAVSLFFNRPVNPDTVKNKGNFTVEGNEVYAGFPQPSGRFAVIGLRNPISPFVESRVRVENLEDTSGGLLTPSPVEMPIRATIKSPGGVVYGRVLTLEGQPVSGAAMYLVESERGNLHRLYTRTGGDGYYQFDFVRIMDESFTVEVMDPSSGRVQKVNSRILSNGRRLNLDIRMQGLGSIKGRVITNDGTAVPGATVTARLEDGKLYEYFQARSGTGGDFVIGDVPLGRFSLTAQKLTMTGSAAVSLDVAGGAGTVDIIVAETAVAVVAGRVLAVDGVTPVEDAYVNFFGSNNFTAGTKTDQDGYFRFDTVPTGSFRLDAYNPLTGKLGGRVSGTLTANQEFNGVIIFRGTGRIGGTVLNYDGTPLEGILVVIEGTSFHMDTGPAGGFDFPEVPVGSYRLLAYNRAGGARAYGDAQLISEGQQVAVTLVYGDGRLGSISGIAYDVNGTTPLPYTSVYVFDLNYMARGTATTGGTGRFQVNGLAAGNYLLVVEREGGAGMAAASVLFPGHPAEQDVGLLGKGTVTVHVRTHDGQTGVMADVDMWSREFVLSPGNYVGPRTVKRAYTTGGNGFFQREGVYMGDVGVSASNAFYPRGADAAGKLTSPGQELVLDLNMRPSGNVKLTVLDHDGVTPVANTAALVFKGGVSMVMDDIYTDEQGEFLFSLVPPGYFSITAEHTVTGLKGKLSGLMGETGDTVDVTLRLRGRGTVEGHVKDEDGAFIAGARLTLKNLGYPYETFTAVSDGTGHYSVEGVPEGDFTLSVSSSDDWNGGSARGNMPSHGAQVVRDVTVTTVPHGTVTGQVLSPDGTTEVADVEVVLTHSRFIDGNGAWQPIGYFYISEPGGYRFEGIPAGSFKLEVLHTLSGRKGRGYGTLETEGEIIEKNILLEGRGVVTGTFFDGSRVTPIPNASIKIWSRGAYPFELVSSTDAEGNFRFSQVGKGGFDLEATDPATGLIGKVSGDVEYEGQEVYANLYAHGTGTVKGRVYFANGAPVPGNVKVEIRVSGFYNPFTVYTGETGFYSCDTVPLGSFGVTAMENPGRDFGKAPGRLEFHGQEAETDVTFKGLASVTGTVRDGNGDPVAGMTVTLVSGSESFSMASDASGLYRFDQLHLGTFSVEARDPVTGLSGTAGGTLTSDGQLAAVDLTLQSAGFVTGRILSGDGVTPAENAAIVLKGSNFTKYLASGADGTFHFRAVKLGNFTVEVQGYNLGGKARTSGQVVNHDETVELGDLVLDNTIPLVTAVTPGNGSPGVPLNTPVTVTFSEPMSAPSLNGTALRLVSGGGNTAGTVGLSGDGTTAVFTPSALLSSFTLYTVVVEASVEDAAGNRLGTAVSASFTTSDTEPPVVVSVSPGNNATGVAAGSVIRVNFNEPVDPAAFGPGNLWVSKGGVTVSGVITFNEGNTSGILTPAALETDAAYSATVQGAVDFSGNTQAAAYTWTFHTVDTIAPTLELPPPPGGTSVIEGSTVPVSASAGGGGVTAVHFFMDGTMTYTDTSPPYQYQLTAPLISAANNGMFLLEALAVDGAGNQSVRRNLTFSLLADTPPQVDVTLTAPADARVYPGEIIECAVSVSDDMGLTAVTLTAMGDVLEYSDTQTPSGKNFSSSYTIPVPSDMLPGTEIIIDVEAVDTRGHQANGSYLVVQVPTDEHLPSVELTSPAEGAMFEHKDIVTIEAGASDDVGLKEVRFYLDDELLATVTEAPFGCTYQVPPLTEDTPAVVKVEAEDLAGKVSEDTVNILLKQLIDVTAPTAKIFSPTRGSLVYAEENLKLKVEAEDDEGVTQVAFYVDGQLYETDGEAPYESVYPVPAGVTAGDVLTVRAVAYDVDGKTGGDEVTVEVVSGIRLAADTTIDENNTDYENETIIIDGGTVNINGAHTFANVLVKGSALLRHSFSTTSKVYFMELTVTGKVVVGAGAYIDVSGRGYPGCRQGGNNTGCGYTVNNSNTYGSCRSAGGSYGGHGGCYSGGNTNGIYGSVENPSHPGSGGGGQLYVNGWAGGSGGGVLRVRAGEVINDGSMGSTGYGSEEAGAGSGGSVWIHTNILTGSGTVRANGGYAAGSSGTAGGGGRVAVYYNDASGFDLTRISAYGGQYRPGGNSSRDGSAGTVYLEQGDSEPQLIIDNKGRNSYYPVIFPRIGLGTVTAVNGGVLTDNQAEFMPDSLAGMMLIPDMNHMEQRFTIIANGRTTITVEGDLTGAASDGDTYRGVIVFPGKVRIENTVISIINGYAEMKNLDITGTSLRHSPSDTNSVYSLSLEVEEKLFIASDGNIQASYYGYPGGGRQGNTGECGYTLGNVPGGSCSRSGGSYGGYGASHWGASVAQIYGSAENPAHPGGGGGGTLMINNSKGGCGGGVIRIEANELENNNRIICQGGGAMYGGAGAGGSIYIRVSTLTGTGIINANGASSSNASGGGGGRIAVYYHDATGFDLTKIAANGGAGNTGNGTNGTIHLQQEVQ